MEKTNLKFYMALSSSEIVIGVIVAMALFMIGGVVLLIVYKNQHDSKYRKIGAVMTIISGYFVVIGSFVGLVGSSISHHRDREKYKDRLTGPIKTPNFVETGIWVNDGAILENDKFVSFYINDIKYVLKTNFKLEDISDDRIKPAYCCKISEQEYYCCHNLYKVNSDSELEIICDDGFRIFVPEYSSNDFDTYFTETLTKWVYSTTTNEAYKQGDFTESECKKLLAKIDELYEIDKLADLNETDEKWHEKVVPFSTTINDYIAAVNVYAYTQDELFLNKNASFSYVITENSGCFILIRQGYRNEPTIGYQYSGGITDILETLYVGI